MSANFPPVPPSLKAIQHYLKAATEHEQRDIVVTYWSRLYAMQTALKLDKKSDEARLLLVSLMDWLEKAKKTYSDNDAITNDVAAQAHIENYALKLFTWADSQDRAGVFNKNVVKAFYTAGMLMDVLLVFGEHTDEIARNCKYAKWKAAYIHNCLKNGETPIPGPMGSDNENLNEDEAENTANESSNNNIGFQQPPGENATTGPPAGGSNPFDPFAPEPPASRSDPSPPAPAPRSQLPPAPAPASFNLPPASLPSYPPPADDRSPSSENSSLKLNPTHITKAQKYCKFASSALNYDDVPEAINNLEKALHLLKTGIDMP